MSSNATSAAIQKNEFKSPYDEAHWTTIKKLGISLPQLEQAFRLFAKCQKYPGQQANMEFAANAIKYRNNGDEIAERKKRKEEAANRGPDHPEEVARRKRQRLELEESIAQLQRRHQQLAATIPQDQATTEVVVYNHDTFLQPSEVFCPKP